MSPPMEAPIMCRHVHRKWGVGGGDGERGAGRGEMGEGRGGFDLSAEKRAHTHSQHPPPDNHAHIRIRTHTLVRAHTYIDRQTDRHTHIHKHTHIYTPAHTYTHTHTHTQARQGNNHH